MDLERELLGVFGRHEVLMAKGQRELLAGLEVSEPVGVGVGGSTCLGIEIVCEYVGDLADGAIGVGHPDQLDRDRPGPGRHVSRAPVLVGGCLPLLWDWFDEEHQSIAGQRRRDA